MEIHSTFYISKVDALHTGETGWLTIRKNDVVRIPNMCLKHKPVIALQRTTDEVGFVNLGDFKEFKNKEGEGENSVFVHAVAVKDFDHTSQGNCIPYNIGHLVLLAPGPWLTDGESCHGVIKIFNLTTGGVGFVPFWDFSWFPNAEVITAKEVYYVNQGRYGGGRPMLSKVGEHLVATWVPRTLRSVSNDLIFHGVSISSGTVGWWKGLRKLDRLEQQAMQATVEEEAQTRMPPGSSLHELVKRWAALTEDRITEVPMPLYGNQLQVAFIPSAAGPSNAFIPPHIQFSGHMLHQPNHMPYPQNITSPNVSQLMLDGLSVPQMGRLAHPTNMCRPRQGQGAQMPAPEEESFGPYDPAPKWDWPPALKKYITELKPLADNIEMHMTGEETVKFQWRKVHEYEIDVQVGEKLIYVCKADVPDKFGMNCWFGVTASGGKSCMLPSRVVGAIDKSDETRDAEIYDMAIIRGGPCLKHPAHDRTVRCCVSFTGPIPTRETCALMDQGYVSRVHLCCAGDRTIVNGVRHADNIGVGNGRSTSMT